VQATDLPRTYSDHATHNLTNICIREKRYLVAVLLTSYTLYLQDVGRLALPSLLTQLCREDLTDDTDMAKALLETLHVLCEVEETETGKVAKGDTGVANVDVFLKVCLAIFRRV